MARGGVFIAGGIAPKILPWLSEGPFLAAFNAKKGHAALTFDPESGDEGRFVRCVTRNVRDYGRGIAEGEIRQCDARV